MEPCIVKPEQMEYTALRLAANGLTFKSPNRVYYTIEDVYFDYGQDWMWTTIVAHRPDGDSWQALTPAQWEKLMMAENVGEVADIVEEIRGDKFNPDKEAC